MSPNEDPTALVDLAVPRNLYLEMVTHLATLTAEAGEKLAPEQIRSSQAASELSQALVTRMYVESESRHRELLRTLADRAEEWVFTRELADALHIESGSKGMAGMFGAFGRRAKHRYDGRKPWDSEWDTVRHEAKYRMERRVAEWIGEIARQGGG